MPVFKASRITEGNLLFRDKIEINFNSVDFYKASIIGYKRVSLRISSVSSVSINQGILFAEIIIETRGGERIVASGFSRSDARKIKSLLIH